MTPHASRAPALPVVELSSWPPRPRSSTSACTTRVRPTMLLAPDKEIWESVMVTLATPSAPASTFPRSPAWRTAASGPPWVFPGREMDVFDYTLNCSLRGRVFAGMLTCGVEVRSCGHASVRIVSELMHMESVLARSQTSHLATYFDCAGVGL